jgi:hypothetical protein
MENRMDGTNPNNSKEIGTRKFNGQMFAFASYGTKALDIQATKEALAVEAAGMTDEELDLATLNVKTVVRRMEDPEEVLVAECKKRLKAGATLAHFWLDSYPRMGSVDWAAIAKATGMTKEKARETFAPTKLTEALKPKA